MSAGGGGTKSQDYIRGKSELVPSIVGKKNVLCFDG